MIHPCSLAERQTLKPYISKKYKKTPTPVDEAFHKSFTSHYRAVCEFSAFTGGNGFPIFWVGDNATNFSSNTPVDIAITSPPYINALDYVRCVKIESAWVDCGCDETFKKIRELQVGDNSNKHTTISPIVIGLLAEYTDRIACLDNPRSRTVLEYFEDMYRNLRCVYFSLRNQGEYHIIIGNNTMRGVYIPTDELIARLAENVGFVLTNFYYYEIRDHRTSIPRKGNGGKINVEYVLSLKKSGN